MTTAHKAYSVVVAAPDGLERERQIFRQTISVFNEAEALEHGALFTAEGWHAPVRGPAGMGVRLRDRLPGAHYFVLVLWDRWIAGDATPSEGRRVVETEEAYRLALACAQDPGKPMRQVVVLFNALDERRITDAGPMMKGLLDFRRSLEASSSVAAHVFDDASGFEALLRRYLSSWLSDHEKGATGKVSKVPGPRVLPSVDTRFARATEGNDGAGPTPAGRSAAERLLQGWSTDAELMLASAAVCADDFCAMNDYAIFLAGQRRLSQAQPVFERLVELAKRSCIEIWEAVSLNNLAEIHRRRGHLNEAEPGFQTALAIREKLGGPEHLEVARVLHNLSELYRAQGRYRLSEPLCRRAVNIREKLLGLQHADTFGLMIALAELHHTQGDFNEAAALYERLLGIAEGSPAVDETLLALCLNDLASLYDDQGQYLKATPFFQRSLQIRERVLGPEHPDVAASLNNLAALLRNRGEFEEAEGLQRRSLEIWERTLGPEHPDFATGLGNLAALCSKRSRYGEAERLHRRALRIRERALGAEHPDIGTSLHNLAEVYRAQGRYEDAAPLLRRTITIWEKTLGAHHPNIAASSRTLADTYRAQRKYGDAEESYRRSIAIMERNFGSSHPELPEILGQYAAVLRETQRSVEAERIQARADAMRGKQAGKTLAPTDNTGNPR
ncbi:MAG: tetratricopeptide repeat protein [Acidobacteria bacterium]|nr:tetratricopeptide repeat protein [Acidobacteriota bacterium]